MRLHNFAHDTEFYYVTIRDMTYVEPDYGPLSNKIEDAVIRIFLNEEDAQRYAITVAYYEMENPEHIRIKKSELSHLLKIVQAEGPKMKAAKGESLRLDSCRMEDDKHPETLTTIYRYNTPKYLN